MKIKRPNPLALIVSLAVGLSLSFGAPQVLASPDAALFGQFRAGFDAAISPDGQRVAVIRSVDGEYIVQVVALDGEENGDALRLGPGAKPKWIKWANNDRVLVSFWGSKEYSTAVRSTGSRFNQSAFNSNSQSGISITVSSIYTIDADTMEGRILVMPKGLQQYIRVQRGQRRRLYAVQT